MLLGLPLLQIILSILFDLLPVSLLIPFLFLPLLLFGHMLQLPISLFSLLPEAGIPFLDDHNFRYSPLS